MFIQYLSPMIIFVSLTMLAIRFPRIGSLAHVLAGLLLLLFLFDLSDHVAALFVMLPMLTRHSVLVRSPATTPHRLLAGNWTSNPYARRLRRRACGASRHTR